jgi:hypothetical protein
MGVTLENGKYRARVSIGGGKRRSLGRYDTKLKAQRAIARYRKDTETITPLTGEGFKNVGFNGRGEVVPFKTNEKLQEKILQDHLDNLDNPTLLEQYDKEHVVYTPVRSHGKTSFFAKLVDKWRSTKQRS